MRSKLRRMRVLIASLAVVAMLALGGSAIAGASGSESDADEAAQAAACQAAGLDTNASNIQYDDETGVCKLDSGADDNEDSGADDDG